MKPFLVILAGCLLGAPLARAHAFIDHAEPAVGSAVQEPPAEVRIWFTEKLVGAFCTLQVLDATGKEVDKGGRKVDPQNGALLVLPLPRLQPGKYTVMWKAVSVDTHVTSGKFTFEVKP
jgi:methionine-rich copper-binding protein CopC